jgi:RimJ/RimL family protein N-acetyltransferase
MAWMPGHFPANAPKAEAYFKENVKFGQRKHYLIICRTETDEIVGGVNLWINGRIANVSFKVAPWCEDAGLIRADALRVMVPWLRDEYDLMNTAFDLAADDVDAIAAAEELGLVLGARLREWIARPGHRVDQLMYQAVNPRWITLGGSENAEATNA